MISSMDISQWKWILKRKFIYGYQWKRIVRKYLMKYYSEDTPKSVSSDRIVICMADGKRRHGGLADRLRSYVTYYGYCKKNGLRFAINFTSPFKLEEYLEPNKYDWRLKPGELTFNSRQARPLFFQTSGPLNEFEKKEQKKLADRYLKDTAYKQYHLYSNYCFGEDAVFAQNFNELFRPVKRIAEIIDGCRLILGPGYISVSTRFMELLGDFKEPRQRQRLDEEARDALIHKCREEIEKLHNQFPDVRMLVTSDSRRFIDTCRDLPYVYIPEGNIEHIDIKGGDADHTKTFVDFFLISGASHVFQIKCGPMYGGNFSLRAAAVGDRPYKLITC